MTVLATLANTGTISLSAFSGGDGTVTGAGLDDVPGGTGPQTTIVHMQGLPISIFGGLSDDTMTCNIRLMSGATVMAAADSGGTFQQLIQLTGPATSQNTSQVTFNYVNANASDALWNATTIEVNQVTTRSMGGDGAYWRFSTDDLVITLENSNRDVNCTTHQMGEIRLREASVAKWAVGDKVFAVIGQTGTSSVTGATGWSFERAASNSTVRLEVWSRVMTGSDQFNWTIPDPNGYIHYTAFPPQFSSLYQDIPVFDTGTGTAITTPQPTTTLSQGKVASFYISDGLGALTTDGICDPVEFEADNDEWLAMGGGTHFLPLAFWTRSVNWPTTENRQDGQGCGVQDDLLIPGGKIGGASQDRNTTFSYNGVSWATENVLPRDMERHFGVGTTTSGKVGGGSPNASEDVYDWNGTSWATGTSMPATTHYSISACGTTGGFNYIGNGIEFRDWNGVAWGTFTAHTNPRYDRNAHYGAYDDNVTVGGRAASDNLYKGWMDAWNGVAWSSREELLTLRVDALGAGTNLEGFITGGRGPTSANAGTGTTYKNFGGAWSVGPDQINGVTEYAAFGGKPGGSGPGLWVAGGSTTGSGDKRGVQQLGDGAQEFGHTNSVSGNWIGATILMETFNPRTVTCTTAGEMTITGNFALVGTTIYGTTAALEIDNTNNGGVIVSGLSYPITLIEVGGINGSTEALTLTGTPANVNKAITIACTTAQIQLLNGTATTIITRPVVTTAEALTLTTNAAVVVQGQSREVVCTTEALQMTATQITQTRDRTFTTNVESLILGGPSAQVTKEGSKEVTGQTAQIILTENNATVQKDKVVAGNTVPILLTETSPATIDWDVIALPEVINLTGTAASVVKVIGRTIVCNTATTYVRGIKGEWGQSALFAYATYSHFRGTDRTNLQGFDDGYSWPSAQLGLDWNDAEVIVFGNGRHRSQNFNRAIEAGNSQTILASGPGVYNDIKEKGQRIRRYSTIKFEGTAYLYMLSHGSWDANDHWIMCGWMKPTSVAGTQAIWSSRLLTETGGGFVFQLDGAEANIYGYNDSGTEVVSSSGISGNVTVTANEWWWWRVAVSFDQTTMSIYLGKESDFGELPTLHKSGISHPGTVSSNAILRWGYNTDVNPRYFTGHMVDFSSSPTRWDGTPDAMPRMAAQYTSGNNWDFTSRFSNQSYRSTVQFDATSGKYVDVVTDNAGLELYFTDPSSWTRLHRLNGTWTLEIKFRITDITQDQNIWSTTDADDIAAGFRVTHNQDASITIEVLKFNTANALTMSSPANAAPYDQEHHLAVCWNNSLQRMAMHINGVFITSSGTQNTPDSATESAFGLHTGTINFGSQQYFSGIAYDHKVSWGVDRYGVENFTVPDYLPHKFTVVQKDREILSLNSISNFVITCNPAGISSNPARNVGGGTEVITLTGNQATVEKQSEFPRTVTCNTESILLVNSVYPATIGIGKDIDGTTEALTLAGNVGGVQKNRDVTSAAEALTLSTSQAQIFRGVNRTVTCNTEAFTITASGAVQRDKNVSGSAEIILLSEAAAGITTDRLTNALSANFTLSSDQGVVQKDREVSCTSPSFTLTANTSVVGQGKLVACQAEVIDFATAAAAINRGRNVSCDTEAVEVTGTKGVVIKGLFGVVDATTESLVLTVNRARVDHMTITNPLPRYDRIGVKVLNPEAAPNNLFSPSEGVSLVTKGASKLSPPIPESDP